MDYAEINVDHKFHRHLIGKNGANSKWSTFLILPVPRLSVISRSYHGSAAQPGCCLHYIASALLEWSRHKDINEQCSLGMALMYWKCLGKFAMSWQNFYVLGRLESCLFSFFQVGLCEFHFRTQLMGWKSAWWVSPQKRIGIRNE